MTQDPGYTAEAIRLYTRAIEMTVMVVRNYLADFPNEPPRFAMGPEGIGIIARVSALAPHICKNKGAYFIVKALHDLSRDFEGGNEPTYMMLLTVLEGEGVPFERVSLADLGIVEHDRRPS